MNRRRQKIALAVALLAIGNALASEVTVTDSSREAYGQPLPGLDAAQRQAFFRGRSLFRQNWVVAPAKDAEVDGLGPLYNRLACLSCHPKNGRGQAPEGPQARMQSMLVRLSIPGQNPHGGPRPHPAYGDQLNEEGIPGVPGEGRAAVSWEESALTLPDGETIYLRKPRIEFRELAYGPLDDILFSLRVGPPVYGMGLLDAVPPGTIRQLARQAKADGVKGRPNRVWNVALGHAEVGKFGLKANMPSLRQQIAGAMLGDLGITSPLFPKQNCTTAQTACHAAPDGGQPELSEAQLDDLHAYLSLLAVPARRDADAPQVRHGEALFAKSGCAACHRPSLQTGKDVAFPQLRNRKIAPYTDLLLHDMGDGLADGRPDFLASGREWRTPPLWGIGLLEKINEHHQLLHDGRARNFSEAILWHGGEASVARQRFIQLDREQREALFAFLRSL